MPSFDKGLIHTPVEPCAVPPKDHKGGPGTYDGLDGFKKRTPSPDAAPEKIIDDVGPLPKGD